MRNPFTPEIDSGAKHQNPQTEPPKLEKQNPHKLANNGRKNKRKPNLYLLMIALPPPRTLLNQNRNRISAVMLVVFLCALPRSGFEVFVLLFVFGFEIE